MLFECFILDCCAVIAAKAGKIVLLQYRWTVHTTTKQFYPFQLLLLDKTMCFLLLAVLCNTYFLYFLFYLQFVYGLQEKTEIELLSPLCCLSIWYIYILYFFSYLVAIKDTLILNCRSVFVLFSRSIGSSAFLPAAFLTVQLGQWWVRSGLSGRGTHWFRLIRFKDLLIRYEVAALSLTICHRVDKPLISCLAWLAFCFWSTSPRVSTHLR